MNEWKIYTCNVDSIYYVAEMAQIIFIVMSLYKFFIKKKKLLVVLTIVNNVLDNICTVQDIYVFHSTEAF